MARLTRRDMKRDEVLETATRFYHYLTDHTRGLVLGALAIVAIAIAISGVLVFLQGRTTRANALFAEALSVYDADIVADGSNADDPTTPTFPSPEARDLRAQELFEKVERDFGGTSVGRIAGAYLGSLAMRGGDAVRAREHWQEFMANGDEHMLTTEVRLNLIALDRAEGRAEEVAARLNEIVASSSAELPTDVALDALAKTLEELGREEEARDAYQRIVDEFPASPFSSRARQKLTVL